MMLAGRGFAAASAQRRRDDPALALAIWTARVWGGDTLLCLSASGRTPYALCHGRAARARGVTVGFANVAGSALLTLADIRCWSRPARGGSGSTRMGAATAQKVALNMLSVLAALRLGHVR